MFECLSGSGIVAAALIAPPGPEMITALDTVDPTLLAASAVADLLVGWERQTAWLGSRTASAVRGVAAAVRSIEGTIFKDDPELAERSLRCEVAAATRLSEISADHRLMVAGHLGGRLTLVDTALRLGDINFWQASAICQATDHLTDAQALWVARRVLPRARKQTLAQLRDCLRRAVMQAAPRAARKNASTAKVRHDIELFPRADGQAELRVTADAADLQAIHQTIQDAARKLGATEKGLAFPRSAGQLRVAALLHLLTGTNPDAATRPYQVTVNVTMDLPTLLGLRDNPATLTGYGPLPPALARTLAADASWRRLIHDPYTGALLDLGAHQYRPSAALARHVRTRDVNCIFPGCNRRAHTCDLDHAHRPGGTGGPTDRHNLHALCKKHHRLKHEAGWTLQTSPTAPPVWIGPLGRRYAVEAYDYRPPDDTDFGPTTARARAIRTPRASTGPFGGGQGADHLPGRPVGVPCDGRRHRPTVLKCARSVPTRGDRPVTSPPAPWLWLCVVPELPAYEEIRVSEGAGGPRSHGGNPGLGDVTHDTRQNGLLNDRPDRPGGCVTSDAPAPPTETVDLDEPPAPPEELTLAAAFPAATREQWATLVAGVVDKSGAKGLTPADAEAQLSVTVGGLAIGGIYGRDRFAAPDAGLPGAAPFVRGRLPQGTLGGWHVRSYTGDPRADAAREQVLVDLENGVTSVWLAVGAAGVPVSDVGAALADVLLDLAPVVLDAGKDAAAAADALLAVAAERGVQVGALSGNLGFDPIGLAVRSGEPPELTATAGYVKQFVDTHGAGLPLRTIVVDATAVHDGGASEAQELGYSIAAGVAYLRALAEVGLSAAEAAGQLEFRYAATDDQFLTIAKLRAARKLWSRISSACGVPAAEQGQLQHAVTSWPMMTKLDPYVNMLRTTIAAFAAGVGGADAVTVLPFDSAIGLPETIGRRVARNTQALLLEESHVAAVIDPAGGSWYVESLTEELAQAGWAEFQAIEAAGGIGHALADGSLVARIHANQADRTRKLAFREDAITGVSEFPKLDEMVLARQDAPVAAGGGLTRIRWAERHEEMRERVEHFKHVHHRTPTVLLVPLESPRAAAARAGFAADLLSPAGITTTELPEAVETASVATVQAALEAAGTTVACLCGTDTAYGESAAPVTEALRAAGATHVMLAGPAKAAADAAIDTFLFRGCDAVAVQEQTLDQLGVAQ